MSEMLSVAEAAKALDLSVRRVRALIDADAIPAERIGRSWVLSRDAVDRFARRRRRRGRRLSSENAWALLALLSGEEPASVEAPSMSRLRRYARDPEWRLELLEHAEPRAKVLPLWMPADDLRKLAEYPLVRSGLSASDAVSHLDVVPQRDEPLDAYADEDVAEEVLRRFLPEEDTADPNVILRVVKGGPPMHGDGEVPLPVVAADLLDHDDPRVRRAAERALRELADAR
jgi:excisionase family DNA binding protein